jgi:hypothetical protein
VAWDELGNTFASGAFANLKKLDFECMIRISVKSLCPSYSSVDSCPTPYFYQMLLVGIYSGAVPADLETKFDDVPLERTLDEVFALLPLEITEFGEALAVRLCAILLNSLYVVLLTS